MVRKDVNNPAGGLNKGIEWSSDPVVLGMQSFAYGYGPNDKTYMVDHIFIRLPWYKETDVAISRSLRMPEGARKENYVRGQGTSRAGKTSASRALLRGHLPWRDSAGLHMPWGYMRVPSVPSVAIIGQEVLRSLGDSSWQQRRSPIERLARIGEVAQMIGLDALIVDDLHHLVDSRGLRVQHAVADSFIDIGNETGVPFIFFGLDRMSAVFDVNEQLRGRTGAPIKYLRLDWRNAKHQENFKDALNTIIEPFKDSVSVDKTMNDPSLPFRVFCSTGGLLGYLALIFRVAEFECRKKKCPLGFDVLRRSVFAVVGKAGSWPGQKDPFHRDFVTELTSETLRVALGVGKEVGPNAKPAGPTRRS